jgi:AcrR family transcriptional regulator
VASAHHSFLNQGYGGTSMDAIASACRISKQTLYRLFPSKSDLFLAVIEAFRSQLIDFDRAHDGMSLQEALEAVFIIDISPEAELRRGEFMAMVVSESHHYPELHDLMHRYGAYTLRLALGGWLTVEAKRRGIDIPDPDRCGAFLMDMIFGPMALKHLCREPVSASERQEHVRRAISVFLYGAAGAPVHRPPS